MLELESAEAAAESGIVELVVAAEPSLSVVEVAVSLSLSVAEESTEEDPEPEPPKQPVGTPAQKKITVPQVCPNLQDQVSHL